jgi:organic hydroperoxide reductase OsmC/OhrA
MSHLHTYTSRLSWQGSTGVGYDGYDRTHHVTTPPADGELVLTSDPAFRGNPALTNPEQLLLAAASSCQLLSFLAMAARSRIDVLSYDDEADAVMPADVRPARITRITLRPHIVVAAGADLAKARKLVGRAHGACYIANTVNAEIVIEPVIEHAGG